MSDNNSKEGGGGTLTQLMLIVGILGLIGFVLVAGGVGW